jgi:hypothetical protein
MAMAVRPRGFCVFLRLLDDSTQCRFLKIGVTENTLFLVGFLFGVRGHAEEV